MADTRASLLPDERIAQIAALVVKADTFAEYIRKNGTVWRPEFRHYKELAEATSSLLEDRAALGGSDG
jgi:hypothetical protein